MMKNIVIYLISDTRSNSNIALFFEHNIYGDKMRFFKYHKKLFFLIISITILALFLHTLTVLDIAPFKRAVSKITKSYNIFIYIFPIIYVLLSICISNFCFSFDNSNRVYFILSIYILMLVFLIFSALLIFRFANFIFAFWLIVITLILDSILVYLLFSTSLKLIYLNGMHISLLSYLSFVIFWLYFKTI